MKLERIKNGVRMHTRAGGHHDFKGRDAVKFLKRNGFTPNAVKKLSVGTLFTQNGVM